MLSGSFELLDSRGPPMSPSLTAGATAPEEVLLFCIFSHVFSFGGHEIQSKALSHGAQAPQCRGVGGIEVAVKNTRDTASPQTRKARACLLNSLDT